VENWEWFKSSQIADNNLSEVVIAYRCKRVVVIWCAPSWFLPPMSGAQINASAPVLSPGVGYGIVLGMGLEFAVLMLAITKLTTRYGEHSASESSLVYTSESASRSLKPGLIASGMFLQVNGLFRLFSMVILNQSKATWAATRLQASTVCLVYGLSGPWWYAAGSSTQIVRCE
jgi:hypothetical protein